MKSSPTLLLDLNHPVDVHFFRDLVTECRKNGISLYITARQRRYLPELLNSYNIPYIKKGKWAHTLLGKIMGLFRETIQLYLLGRKIKADVFISLGSPYAALAGKLLGKPVITLDDTEFNPLIHKIYPRLSDLILTPECFQKSFGKKHLRFAGYKESVYLKNVAEEKETDISEIPGLDQTKPFILVRFVARHSTHELGKKGLRPEIKEQMINCLKQYGRVYISSEGELPENLKPYELKAPIAQMHRVMKKASLYLGESTTMAAEAALLGTPAILLEDKGRGYTEDIGKRTGLLQRFMAQQWPEAIKEAKTILLNRNKEKTAKIKKLERIFSEITDINKLLIWIIQNPERHIKKLKNFPKKMNEFH